MKHFTRTLLVALFAILVGGTYNLQAQPYAAYNIVTNPTSASFTDISATGTPVGLTSDDDYELVTMPFTFYYWGISANTMSVSWNGGIEFGATSASYISFINDDLTQGGNDNYIAPLWDDMDDEPNSKVVYETIGTAPNRIFIVQWDSLSNYYHSPSLGTWQVQLHESTGRIYFFYPDIDFGDSSSDGATATMGIKGTGAAEVAQFSYNTAQPNIVGLLFDPMGIGCTITCPDDITVGADPGNCEGAYVNVPAPTVEGCSPMPGDVSGTAPVSTGTATVNLSLAPPAGPGTGTLEVTLNGDFGTASSESVEIDVEGIVLGTEYSSAGDCNAASFTYTISAADMATITADGQVDVNFTPTGTGVNPTLCTTNEYEAHLTYPVSSGLTFINDYNNTADASDTYPIGTTEVTWKAYDASTGTFVECTMNVTVEDLSGPEFQNCPGDFTVTLDAGDCMYRNFIDTLIATDCAGAMEEGALFTTNAGNPANFFNAFAGVTFDVKNESSQPMEIRGFKVPLTGATTLDMDVYYTTTASTNVGVQTDPSEWTLLESLTGIPAQNATAWDVNTFTQVTLNNTLTLQPGESKGIYVLVTNYTFGGPTYHYTNGNFTETDGNITILSNGFGSTDTPFGNTFAGRAFVGEVQYAIGGNAATVTQVDTSGFELGDALPIGTHCFEFVAEDADGNTSTCSFCVTVEEFPEVRNNLVCNDLVKVYLDDNCEACINADDVLEGGRYGCYEGRYSLEVSTDADFNNVILDGHIVCFDGTYAGQTLYTRVTDDSTGVSCVGRVQIIDGTIPDLLCSSYSLTCGDDLLPNAEAAAEEAVLYSNNDTATIDPGTVSCAAWLLGTSEDNHYFKVMDMNALGITDAFTPETFRMGIGQAAGADIDIVVRFYTFNDPTSYDPNGTTLDMNNMTQIGADFPATIPAGTPAMSMWQVDISSLGIQIPSGTPYTVVELFVPSNNQTFITATNSAGGMTPTYLMAPDCGANVPTSIQSLVGYEEPVLLMVYGSVGSGAPFPLPDDVTITPTTGTGPFTVSGFDPCGDVTLTYTDQVIEGTCADDYASIIYRTWVAEDASGNTTTCTDTITVKNMDLSTFEIPGYVVINCEDPWDEDGDGHPDPELTGAPEQGLCGIFYGYEDLVIDICEGTKKFVRDYTALWCCTGDVVEGTQVIKIIDDTPPEVECPADAEIGTGFYSCAADYVLPAPTATDACSPNGITWTAESSAGTIENGVLKDLPVGSYEITYTVSDGCGNSTTCVHVVTVVDDVPPIAVCDQNTKVAIGGDGTARVHWETIEDGSYDNCEIVDHEVRRVTGQPSCGIGTGWGEYVDFCCADIGTVVQVEYRVTDAGGLTNICTVNVRVEDNIPPQIEAPDNVEVSCNYPIDMTDLSAFGEVANLTLGETVDPIVINDPNPCGDNAGAEDGFATDNCGVTVVELDPIDMRNDCGMGRIIRRWQLLDPNGEVISGSTVSQIVEVISCNPFDENNIVWPADFDGSCGDSQGGDYGEPTYTGNYSECSMIAATYEDQVFEYVPGYCFKILRHWTVINCCIPEKEEGHGIWTYTQIIKVMNSEGPDIVFDNVAACDTASTSCAGYIELIPDAEGCVPADLLEWSYRIDLNSDGSWDVSGQGRDASGDYAYGTHTIEFTANDMCGNTAVESFSFTVEDCTKPTPVCYTLATEVMESNGEVTLNAKLFDAGSFDNCTSSEDLIISFSSDPTDTTKTFTCADIPDGVSQIIELEIWVTDAAGNQAYCIQTLDLQDNEDACPDGGGNRVSGQVRVEETGVAVEGAEVAVEKSNVPTPMLQQTDASGMYSFVAGANYSYEVTSRSNADVLNGVSTWDLTLIQQHILGMNEIVSPYKLIAADINRDGRLTPIDLVQLRRVILQLDKEFPSNSSWQMVDAAADLENGEVPVNYDQVITLDNVTEELSGQDFIAVKIGDVNNTADAQGAMGVEVRSGESFTMEIADASYTAGSEVRVPVIAGENASIYGYQMTLEIASGLQYAGIEAGEFNLSDANVGTQRASEGLVSMSWNVVEPMNVKAGDVLFTLVFEASESGDLRGAFATSDVITRNEAYVGGEIETVELRVGNEESGLFALYQNEPNPFNDVTSISFTLPNRGEATLTIYDVQGRVEYTSTSTYEAGTNTVQIERSELGAAGVKYYTLKSGEYTATKKMIIIK